MNIVCATDDVFVQHCSIMLVSVLRNNRNVSVYVLSEGLREENISKIRTEVETNGGNFNFLLVDKKIIEKFPMPDLEELKHISVATYYRLLIDTLLPDDLDKVLYLDCDIIVRKSLEGLWNLNLEEYALAAVGQPQSDGDCLRLGYDLSYGYFNAGVLLINLKFWRKNNIAKSIIQLLSDNDSRIKYHDQDALNLILHNKRFPLSPQWNMLYQYFTYNLYEKVFSEQEKKNIEQYSSLLKKEINDPTIIHYSSKPKPWELNCYHPWQSDYYNYAKLSLNFKNVYRPAVINIFFSRMRKVVFNYLFYCKKLVFKN
nr:glycosyltransferase family 8 protein [uncultured Flavobacterium sp.]